MSSRKIIVSNRLPVTIQQQENDLIFNPSAGGLATGLGSIYKEKNNIWLGWPGFYNYENQQVGNITKELKKQNLSPVFLTKEDVEDYYEGFSNKVIWPLFHYFSDYARFESHFWEAYRRVNQTFCDEIVKIATEEDVIWVHDYQLLLLPKLIRSRLPKASIGFFQHIPFPSFEIFRLLPWREEILEGFLGADLIGFHTYDDMRHFLSSVSRILGFPHQMGEIKVQGRIVAVDSFPMGIDYDKFFHASSSKETLAKSKDYKKILSPQKVILSIDRLDYSKGIKHRLNAFDLFLEKYPAYIGKVSLILIVVPSRAKVDKYQQLKEEIDTIVGRIEGKYSQMDWAPIHYFYRSFDFHSLSALYSNAEVAMITPLRDGMNLVCKEFIASKKTQEGVLILSEMAGAAKELSEAILVNPHDVHQLIEAMRVALEMPAKEQKERISAMQKTIKRYSVHQWVSLFMNQLLNVKKKQQEFNMKLISSNGLIKIKNDYSKAEKRILFLDYDGTLVGFNKNPLAVAPDDGLIKILKNLTSDKKNKVVIISGRDKNILEKWLGELELDIIAEHGVWLKENTKEWEMIDELDQSWKGHIKHVLEMYVDRTPGSFIEEKDFSLAWHYRSADTEFGEMRARDLISNVSYLILNMDLQMMEGNKVIEIKNRDVNKGKAARKWLQKDSYDFVLAIGDDVTDEDTFQNMPESAHTLKVGLIASKAKCNIKSFKEVRDMLSAFSN